MSEKLEAWSILIALLGVVVGSYLLAWRGKRLAHRRWSSGVLAAVSALAAYVWTFGYVLPGFDASRSSVSFREGAIGDLVELAICAVPWIIAVRFAIIALKKTPD